MNLRTVLSPVILLMQRLQVLPKFVLITVAFMAPMLLLLMLLHTELQRTVTTAERERTGIRVVGELERLTRLVQTHRAARHLVLSGNAGTADAASRVQDEIRTAIARITASGIAETHFETGGAWPAIRTQWDAIGTRLPTAKPKDSYADHTLLIEKLTALKALVADKSGMTLDPEAGSNHLAALGVHELPGIADILFRVAARGASYIDTGLLEPNEDVELSSGVMVARRDLVRIPAQFDAVFRENPELRARLEPRLAAVPVALDFLERAQNEVLKSVDQTSGSAFFDAGRKSTDAIDAAADASLETLDELLAERIARYSVRLRFITLSALGGLAITFYLLAGFYVSFRREVALLEHAVARVASGDLTHQVSSDATDEIGKLVNAFGRMNARLAHLVMQVRAGSEAITRTSQTINAGNADLSARTETQASSLEETASSMSELTSTVRQNDRHAAQANQLAVSAAAVATQGGQAVDEVTARMSAIKESACRILDIVGVIDGIAFQTNLLALNAAVEAARAGSQGKGFAVVAAEVRALAQRSAVAAKEVKALIEGAVRQIEDGNKLAGDAGATMKDVVASIQRVADIMTEISAASREQTAGIEQVHQAISQMDEVTQRNAALVEQAAGSSASLQEQARKLSQAVSSFRLEQSIPAVAHDEVHAPSQPSLTLLSRFHASNRRTFDDMQERKRA